MKFTFIAKHRSIWPSRRCCATTAGQRVAWLCEALGVSRSGVHAWLHRSPSEHARYGEALLDKIKDSFKDSDRTYGARRVWHDPLAEGLFGVLHRVERLMRENALRARPRRHVLPKDDGKRPDIMPNVLDGQFAAARPNQKWVADFTYLSRVEGWLYVAAVIDLFSPRVVGWSMNANMTAQFATYPLIMAIWRRGKPDVLLHHRTRVANTRASNSSASWPITTRAR